MLLIGPQNRVVTVSLAEIAPPSSSSSSSFRISFISHCCTHMQAGLLTLLGAGAPISPQGPSESSHFVSCNGLGGDLPRGGRAMHNGGGVAHKAVVESLAVVELSPCKNPFVSCSPP